MSIGPLLERIFRKKSVVDLHQESSDREAAGTSLVKSLNLLDLTCFGIAAVVGAGIFTTLGKAAAERARGPCADAATTSAHAV